MKEQLSGFGGHQNRDNQGAVGPHGELFSGSTSDGLIRPA